MKTKLVLTFLLLNLSLSIMAQKTTVLKEVMRLQMPDGDGSNGAMVVWNPLKKQYYASFAGNSGFPMAVFDATGKRISKKDLETMYDVRGMWFDTDKKELRGNGYDDAGWVRYTLDDRGIPLSISDLYRGFFQPEAHSVGTYDADKKWVCFLANGVIQFYNDKGELQEKKALTLNLGGLNFEENYNRSTAVFTGVKKAEFGVLNHGEKEVELYNRKDGKLSQKWQLPADAPTADIFNFAYANGIVWLFDRDERVWIGYGK